MSKAAIRLIEDGTKIAIPSWLFQDFGRFKEESLARKYAKYLEFFDESVRVGKLCRRTVRRWVVFRIKFKGEDNA